MSALYLLFAAICLSVLEGVTEWLPVSSTGHLILLDRVLGMEGAVSPAFYAFFLVAIQLGAVLAVVVLYFDRLNPWSKSKSLTERKKTFSLWKRVLIGVLPAALIGIPLDDFFEEHFYTAGVIASALILYGVALILLERRRGNGAFRVESVFDLSYRDAVLIGCFQILSLVPGTSRSGSTILGGMLLGVSRSASAEFSFFMAIPVMLGASFVRGAKFVLAGGGMSGGEISLLLIGMLTAFFVSLITIRALVNFVKRHSFKVFGVYRIFLGILVLLFHP